MGNVRPRHVAPNHTKPSHQRKLGSQAYAARPHPPRHCERSDAIQLFAGPPSSAWIASPLRASRWRKGGHAGPL